MLLSTGHVLLGQQIQSFDPPFGSSGEQIIITGTGFYPGTLVVRFGGANGVIDTTARATSASTIYAHVPVNAASGPIYVQVGAQAVTSVADFQVLGLGPYIRSFSPAYGSINENLIIEGWHLGNPSAVKFGSGTTVNGLPNAQGSQISVRVPPGAATGLLTVTTVYGSSNSVTPFTVIGTGPYIGGFTPNAGMPGTTIYISGAHLTGITNVSFDGKPGVNLFVQSDTSVVVDAPPGVTTGFISVRSTTGGHTNSSLFFVPPVITGFSPSSGRAGTNINVTGTNLLGITTAYIDGTPARVLAATNNRSLWLVAPTNGPSGYVRVSNPGGSAMTTSNFCFQPMITAFSPMAGPAGTVVTISGANLNEGFRGLTFGGTNAVTNAVSSGQVIALAPGTGANGPITITTTNGSFTTSNRFCFPPVITGFAPSNSPPGNYIALDGVNLLGVTNVSFSGKTAVFNIPTNNLRLFALVPAGVLTGPLSVSSPGGSNSFGRFYGPPALTSFTPPNGIPGATVMILGTNFLDVTAVRFNGADSTFQVASNGAVVAVLPVGATTGPISVSTPAGTVSSSRNFVVDLASDLGVTLVTAPNTLFIGSNVAYTLSVTNSGPFPAPNAKVEFTFPSGFTLRSNIMTKGSVSTTGSKVTAALGTMAVNATNWVKLFVAYSGTGTLPVSAVASSDYPDLHPEDDVATASVLVLPMPVLGISRYSPSQYRIYWPLELADRFSLEFREPHVLGGGWSNSLVTPTPLGTNTFIVEPTDKPARLYRLRGQL